MNNYPTFKCPTSLRSANIPGDPSSKSRHGRLSVYSQEVQPIASSTYSN